jgi:hypothetical protein
MYRSVLGAIHIATLATLGLFVLAASSQAASSSDPATTDTWTGSPAADPRVDKSYCAAEGKFSNGLTLGFALNPPGEFSVVVGLPKAARFEAGASFPIALAVDGLTPRQVTGQSRSGPYAADRLIILSLGRDEAFTAAVKTGSVLSIAGPNDIATFSLNGSQKVLDDITACIDHLRPHR